MAVAAIMPRKMDVCDAEVIRTAKPERIETRETLVESLKQSSLFSTPPNSSSAIKPAPQSACKDREPAKRLAKRLYNLSGLKKSDVCPHLVKVNPFNQMVAEEYLNLFDFKSMELDAALRKFLSKLVLNGETQERERMLSQFSQRYYDCNKGKFPNSDCVQTLVCALVLLNSDLHAPHSKKSKRSKISLDAFIDVLNNSVMAQCMEQDSGLSSASAVPYTFPRSLIIHLFESIRKKPLKCGSDDKCDKTLMDVDLKQYGLQVGGDKFNTLPTRRFGHGAPFSTLTASSRRQFKLGLRKMNGLSSQTNQEERESTIQFKSGYLNRKRVYEAHRKPTGKGRRGWLRVYVILQDLHMIIRFGNQSGDEQSHQKEDIVGKKRAQVIAQDMKNTIRINHTFANKSTTYTKREHVFHLRLSDQSEFLMQANNEQDLNSWVETINFATACLSSPALPSAISNSKSSQQNQRASHKPILPMGCTKLSYWEQLIDHDDRLQRLKVELDEYMSQNSRTKNVDRQYKTEFAEQVAYLKHEIERYSVYVDLMLKKSNSPEAIVLSKHPHIASLTPSEEMIKSLPSFAPRTSLTLEVSDSVAE